MAYKVLGWVVWKGGRWLVRRRYGRYARPAAGALVAGALVAIVIAARGGDDR